MADNTAVWRTDLRLLVWIASAEVGLRGGSLSWETRESLLLTRRLGRHPKASSRLRDNGWRGGDQERIHTCTQNIYINRHLSIPQVFPGSSRLHYLYWMMR